jgi:3-oxoadipate enol-lactonase
VEENGKMIIKTGDAREFYYEAYGDPENPTIVLIHGLGAESGSWINQSGFLADQGYYVLVPDMLGHGKSSNLGHDGLNEWNSQILDLLNNLKRSIAVVIGVSMGGVIAMNFTICYPSRVSALVVSDSFAELITPQEKLLGFSQILGFRVFKLLGRKLFAKGMAAAYPQKFADNAREYMFQQSLKSNFNELLKSRKAINSISAIDALGHVRVPSLVIVGSEFGDSFVKINQKIANALPGSKFVVLKQSMDPSPLVNPRAFNRNLSMFLGKIRSDSISDPREDR